MTFKNINFLFIVLKHCLVINLLALKLVCIGVCSFLPILPICTYLQNNQGSNSILRYIMKIFYRKLYLFLHICTVWSGMKWLQRNLVLIILFCYLCFMHSNDVTWWWWWWWWWVWLRSKYKGIFIYMYIWKHNTTIKTHH